MVLLVAAFIILTAAAHAATETAAYTALYVRDIGLRATVRSTAVIAVISPIGVRPSAVARPSTVVVPTGTVPENADDEAPSIHRLAFDRANT